MDENSLLSDLIKIGIPSLVALAGTISSLILALWNQKQNLALEQARHSYDTDKERHHRTGELAKECARDINKSHHAFRQFSDLLYAKIDTLQCNEVWPETEDSLIKELYANAVVSLQSQNFISASLALLGSDHITNSHKQYHKTTAYLLGQAGQREISEAELSAINDSAEHHKNMLLQGLSDIFLMRSIATTDIRYSLDE